MTPMQQLKNNLNILSEILSENFIEINLNKAKSKVKYAQMQDDEYCLCFPDGGEIFEKKEIKSDFIKLFKTKTKTENYSLGLHFYFLNKEKNEQFINVSLQIKDKKTKDVSFLISKNLTIEEFKERLNKTNNNLSINNSLENIINNIRENLLGNLKPEPGKKQKIK